MAHVHWRQENAWGKWHWSDAGSDSNHPAPHQWRQNHTEVPWKACEYRDGEQLNLEFSEEHCIVWVRGQTTVSSVQGLCRRRCISSPRQLAHTHLHTHLNIGITANVKGTDGLIGYIEQNWTGKQEGRKAEGTCLLTPCQTLRLYQKSTVSVKCFWVNRCIDASYIFSGITWLLKIHLQWLLLLVIVLSRLRTSWKR